MKRMTILGLFLSITIFSQAQHNLSDSLERRIHEIDSIFLEKDKRDNYDVKQLHGSFQYLGDCDGQAFTDKETTKISKIVLNYYGGTVIFYCDDKTLLKLHDKDDYYYLYDAYYNHEGVKAKVPELIQQLNELKKIFQTICLLPFSDD